eukprot:3256130-Prorocentrum_lima.AAC.1
MTSGTWLSSNGTLWPLVLPTKAVTTTMNLDEKAPWSEVAAELRQVVSSGELGKKLFGFAVG